MKVGLDYLEYRIDGGSTNRVDLRYGSIEDTFQLEFPDNLNGYAVVEIWVYDIAGNCGHRSIWCWLDHGHLESIQPTYDGKVRMSLLPDALRFRDRDDEIYVRNVIEYTIQLGEIPILLEIMDDVLRISLLKEVGTDLLPNTLNLSDHIY